MNEQGGKRERACLKVRGDLKKKEEEHGNYFLKEESVMSSEV